MTELSIAKLNEFIVKAKSNSYVGGGRPSLSYRPGSHDLQFNFGDYSYLDSYFGGRNFLGQEVVYFETKPVWAMNYHGYILDSSITGSDSGRIIKESLTKLYAQNRFLGGFENRVQEFKYIDTNEGDVSRFSGKEWILKEDIKVYELLYHGGLIVD